MRYKLNDELKPIFSSDKELMEFREAYRDRVLPKLSRHRKARSDSEQYGLTHRLGE